MRLYQRRSFVVPILLLLGGPLLLGAQPKAAPPLLTVPLSGENKQHPLPGGDSFTYEFTQQPKLGTTVLRVRLSDAQGRRITTLRVTGRYGMPEMAGAHDSGEKAFMLNKKGDYLLPVDVVMPGEWEVHIVFHRGDKPLFHGVFRFEV
jgi:hypothetical protein